MGKGVNEPPVYKMGKGVNAHCQASYWWKPYENLMK